MNAGLTPLRDHLGNIREMVDDTGTIKARYDYDPYGRQTKIVSIVDADFGYAGMYVHWPSGLSLTLFRPYSADLARWLANDPIGEFGGLNLYAYVANNPIIRIDLFGLEGNPVSSTIPGMSGAWNSNPYGPGGGFYDPGYQYHPECESANPWEVALAEIGLLIVLGLITDGIGDLAAGGDIAAGGVDATTTIDEATELGQLEQEGNQIIEQENQINTALNQASENVAKAEEQLNNATTQAQIDAANEQLNAAWTNFRQAYSNYRNLDDNLGN